MFKNKIFKFMLILGTIAVVIVVQKKLSEKPAFEIEIGEVREGNLDKMIMASGRVNYANSLVLRTEVSGLVKSILVKEGDFVTKGQTILKLDSSIFQADVDQQKASLRIQNLAIEKSKIEKINRLKKYKRRKVLSDKGLINTEQIELLKRELTISEVELKIALQDAAMRKAKLQQSINNLNRTVIVSPIDGMVTSIPIKVGETAIAGMNSIAGSELAMLADTSKYYAELFVDEVDIAKVKVGQHTKITLVAYPDVILDSIVEKINIVAEPRKPNRPLKYKVFASLDITNNIIIKPEMSCRSEIVYQTIRNKLLVPIESVITDKEASIEGDEIYLFVLKGKKVFKRYIQVGAENDQFQVVNSGSIIGEQLVVGPYETLLQLYDGASVNFE